MRDLTHRILFIAGTTLLAAAVIYGAPSTTVWPDQGRTTVQASAADLRAVIGPLRVVLNRKSAHRTDTVKPNGASCPGANTTPAIPPASDASPEENTVPNSSTASANGKVATPCPANGSDARADIARGHAIATPEPLNSKQLIAPSTKTPG